MPVPVAQGTISTDLLFWNTSSAFMATPVLQKPTVAVTFSLVTSSSVCLRPSSGLALSSRITSSSGRPR
jgi:hypothetical protein